MELISYKSFGIFNFKDTYSQVLLKKSERLEIRNRREGVFRKEKENDLH